MVFSEVVVRTLRPSCRMEGMIYNQPKFGLRLVDDRCLQRKEIRLLQPVIATSSTYSHATSSNIRIYLAHATQLRRLLCRPGQVIGGEGMFTPLSKGSERRQNREWDGNYLDFTSPSLWLWFAEVLSVNSDSR